MKPKKLIEFRVVILLLALLSQGSIIFSQQRMLNRYRGMVAEAITTIDSLTKRLNDSSATIRDLTDSLEQSNKSMEAAQEQLKRETATMKRMQKQANVMIVIPGAPITAPAADPSKGST